MGLTAPQENVKIKFVSRALKDDLELLDMMETSKSLNHDITFVQETHRTGSDILNFEDGWKFLHSLRHEHAQGVGMIISPNTRVDAIEYVMDSHIVHALLTLSGIKISAICAYNDRECSTESSTTMLFTKLKKTIAMNKKKYPEHRTLVVGNFNNLIETDVVSSRDLEPYRNENETVDVISNHDYDHHHACVKNESNYMKLCTLCEDLKLYVLNTVPQNEDMNSFTWKDPTGYIRHVDYFLADYLMTQCTTNCIAYQDGCNRGVEKSEILLVLESECSNFTHYLEQLMTDFQDDVVNPDITENTDNSRVEETVGIRTSDQYEQEIKASRPPPWYDNQYQCLLQDLRNCTDITQKKELKQRLKKERIRLKSAYYKQKVSDVSVRDEIKVIQNEFCRLKRCKYIKRIKYLENFHESNHTIPIDIIIKNNNIESINEIVNDVDIKNNEHNNVDIKNNYVQNTDDKIETRPPEIVHPENYPFLKPDFTGSFDKSPPSASEIDTALKSIILDKKHENNNSNNSKGREFVHSKPFSQVVISLVRTMWMLVMYPACWLHSRLDFFLKSTAPPNVVKNYTGISLGSALNKILTSVIFGRIKTLYESNIMECQFGFRKNRSSTDAVFTVRKMLEYTDGFYIACLVDLESAYNNISNESLFDVLEIRTGSKLIGQLIRELYYNTSAAMYSAKETIRTLVGCLHAESPCLLEIYMDFVLRVCQHEVLQKYPKTGLKYKYDYPADVSSDTTNSDTSFMLRLLACGDDLIVMSRDIEELEHVMGIYYRVFKRFGITLDIGKIRTIALNANEDLCMKNSVITINGFNVANVREANFLGYVISNIDQTESLEHCITSAFQKWSEMENIFIDREIHLPIRVRLLETFVRSRLLYLIQVRKLNPIDLKKVDGVWTNLLRRMVKGGFKRHKTSVAKDKDSRNWSYLYSNREIANITNSKPLLKVCETQYLKYIARVVRQQDSFYPKIMLFAHPEKKNVRCEWAFLEEFTGLGKRKLQRLMMNKDRFTRWLNER